MFLFIILFIKMYAEVADGKLNKIYFYINIQNIFIYNNAFVHLHVCKFVTVHMMRKAIGTVCGISAAGCAAVVPCKPRAWECGLHIIIPVFFTLKITVSI